MLQKTETTASTESGGRWRKSVEVSFSVREDFDFEAMRVVISHGINFQEVLATQLRL